MADEETTPIPINHYENNTNNIHENLSKIFSTNEFKASITSNSNRSRRLSMLLSQTILVDASQEKKSSMIYNFENDNSLIPFERTNKDSSLFTASSDASIRLSFN